MESSKDVRDALLGFYRAVAAGDEAAFERLVSADGSMLVIGTAPGEWVTDRDRLRAGFRGGGVRIDDADPTAWAEGTLGWAVDRPAFRVGDATVRTRLTSIWHRADGRWTMVHLHVSIGVPDAEAAGLQGRWDDASRGLAPRAEGQDREVREDRPPDP